MTPSIRSTLGTFTVALMLLAPVFIASQTGCQNMPTVAELATPARIQAVTALGAYYAGYAAIEKGGRETIQKTKDALQVIWDSKVADLPAVIAALKAGGITILETGDGSLAIGAVLTFSDLWDGTAGKIVNGERVRAVIAGCLRGFDIALSAKKTRGISPVNMQHAELVDDVIATRPARRR